MTVIAKLPDGSKREFAERVTPYRVAEDISPRLAKAAVAAVVDGKAVDLNVPLPEGEHEVKLLTDRDEQGLEVLRHTAAHVLAQAVVRLYGPEVKYTIGPALMDDFQYGFYYDFDLPQPISQEDLPKIEAEMAKVVNEKIATKRIELDPTAAKAQMGELGQNYKVEMIDDLLRRNKGTGTSFKQRNWSQSPYFPLPPGRVPGYVPRAAPARHRAAQGVQAFGGRGRVLARR